MIRNIFQKLFKSGAMPASPLPNLLDIAPHGEFTRFRDTDIFVGSSSDFDFHIQIKVKARQLADIEAAKTYLSQIDAQWINAAIDYAVTHKHIPLEDYIPEPDLWLTPEQFKRALSQDPTLFIGSCVAPIGLTMTDGNMFGGHQISVWANAEGKIRYASIDA